MHPHLKRHLRKLGLDESFASVTPETWARFLDRVSHSYTDADQETYLLERSLTIASGEMDELHGQLAAAANRYTDLFNDAPAIYVITRLVDGQHVISDCNDRTLEVLGYTREQLVGQSVTVLCQHDGSIDLQSAVHTQACEIYDARGGRIETVVRAIPEWTQAGLVAGARIMFLDVAGHQELRQAIRANKAKNDFLSRMSHELRTPMNAVLGFAQLLELDSASEEQSEYIGHIMSAGRHMLRMIDEILDISRIEAGSLDLLREPFAVGAVVEAVMEMLQPLALSAGIQLSPEPIPLGATAIGDPQRASQVLLNLVSNAVKYNRADGRVVVSVECDANRVVIHIRDTGAGITEANLGHLFEPFSRLGAERTAIPGTGLGLALSQRLAEAMDGTLTVVSQVGVGSTFSLELPGASEAAAFTQQDAQPLERVA